MNVIGDLEAAAGFSAPGRGVTRLAWAPEHLDSLQWLIGRLRENDIPADLDAAGNVIGRWAPDGAKGPAICLGSHFDSVPAGGKFDGALGVVGALGAIELLRERNAQLQSPLWLGAFMDEEGARFGESMFGSRAFVGQDLDDYLQLLDEQGQSVQQAMEVAGLSAADLPSACAVDQVGAFLELHIEQGRVLAEAGADIGVVTGVVGLLQGRITVKGQSDHGGATPMPERRDALVASARMITELRNWARQRHDCTATVGTISVSPGAYNVIPGECTFSIDVRLAHPDEFQVEIPGAVEVLLRGVARDENVEITGMQFTDCIPPAAMSQRLQELIQQAAEDEGASDMRLPSGAGHDAQILARHVPVAMIFVPSKDGISHSPDEFTSDEHCELGARVLARTVELMQGTSWR